MSESDSHDARELLQHVGWVRGLARSLVDDVHLADDVAQEALRSALAHPPESRANLRGWLSVLTKNSLRGMLRSGSRRQSREKITARAEPLPSTYDAVERLDTHRSLIDELQALPDPYRNTLVLRFFEERSLAEIAEHMGVPVSTVNSRIRRGLDRLRDRLDRRNHGDRSAWVLALLPLVTREGVASAAAASSAGTSGTSGSAAAGNAAAASAFGGAGPLSLAVLGTATVLLLVFLVTRPGPDGDDRLRASGSNPTGSVASAPDAESAIDLAAPEATPLAPTPARPPIDTSSAAVDPVTEPAAGVMLRGLAIDLGGAPLASVEIGFLDSRPQDAFPNARVDRNGAGLDASESDVDRRSRASARCRTDRLGEFELQAPRASGRLVVLEPGLTTALAGVSYDGLSTPRVLVAAPTRAVTGRVTDPLGDPIAGAAVALHLPEGLRNRFDVVLDHSVELGWSRTTDANGWFQIEDSPAMVGVELVVQHPGYPSARHVLPDEMSPHVEIELDGTTVDTAAVAGYVADAQGDAVESATVVLGTRRTSTDASGRFAFDTADAVDARRLAVLRPGYLPSYLELDPGETWPSPILITLRGEPRTITGRVLHADGTPAAGAWVWLADPTALPVDAGDPVVLESILSGARAQPGWQVESADGRGRFRLHGLLERDYCVRASIAGSSAMAELDTVAAGSRGIELHLPGGDDVFPEIRGCVRDPNGNPLGGILVTASATALAIPGGYRWQANGPSVRTDAAGRFVLADVPRNARSLHLAGETVFTTDVPLAEIVPRIPEELDLVIPRQCHLRFEAPPGAADSGRYGIRDADGNVLTMRLHLGIAARPLREVALQDGTTPVLAVPETAREIIEWTDGGPVSRARIQPEPGEITIVRL